jgi:hypothetical protein
MAVFLLPRNTHYINCLIPCYGTLHPNSTQRDETIHCSHLEYNARIAQSAYWLPTGSTNDRRFLTRAKIHLTSATGPNLSPTWRVLGSPSTELKELEHEADLSRPSTVEHINTSQVLIAWCLIKDTKHLTFSFYGMWCSVAGSVAVVISIDRNAGLENLSEDACSNCL